MIKVWIELWPHGSEERKELIGLIDIINDGTGTKNTGNYITRMYRKGSIETVTRRGEVKNFARLSRNVYDLLLLSLQDLLKK